MAWNGDMGWVFEAFRADAARHTERFRRHPRIGDQAFISDILVGKGRAPRTFRQVLRLRRDRVVQARPLRKRPPAARVHRELPRAPEAVRLHDRLGSRTRGNKNPRWSEAHTGDFRGSGDKEISAAGSAAGGQRIPPVWHPPATHHLHHQVPLSLGRNCSSGWHPRGVRPTAGLLSFTRRLPRIPCSLRGLAYGRHLDAGGWNLFLWSQAARDNFRAQRGQNRAFSLTMKTPKIA
jgi:hypothetical protein